MDHQNNYRGPGALQIYTTVFECQIYIYIAPRKFRDNTLSTANAKIVSGTSIPGCFGCLVNCL